MTALAGWKGGKQELKRWISAIERVQRWKTLKVTMFEYRHELQEEQMGYLGYTCVTGEMTHERTPMRMSIDKEDGPLTVSRLC